VPRHRPPRGAAPSPSYPGATKAPSSAAALAAARVAEAQRLILRALAHRVDEGRFGADDAVDIALVQLGRPGGPRLSDAQKHALRRGLALLARSLSPPTPRALHTFAHDAAQLAWTAERPARSPGATLRDIAHSPDTSQIARAAVYAELLHARDDDDLVRRAVRRAVLERRRALPGVPVPLASGDPLRNLLDLPAAGRLRLPRPDVRGTIARIAANDPAFGDTLRKAARFARHVLEPALGEELWLLCRPVGFVDRAETRVLVAAESSLGAQEMQLRARELVYRLRQVDGFAAVDAVRVVVDPLAYKGLTPGAATTTTTSKATRSTLRPGR